METFLLHTQNNYYYRQLLKWIMNMFLFFAFSVSQIYFASQQVFKKIQVQIFEVKGLVNLQKHFSYSS